MRKNKLYTEKQHLHNYAVWTAARAAQRGFTTTQKIGEAINYANLINYYSDMKAKTPGGFDFWHKNVCSKLMESFALQGLECAYGRAAKIVAIYLKTSEIIINPRSIISKNAHPPIDRILLSNLRKKETGHPKFDPKGEFKNFTWTQAGEESYFSLINHLRTLGFKRFWEIEEYWNV